MAMTAAPSEALGPRNMRLRSTHRLIAPTSPKAVRAMPTIRVPLIPRRKGNAARRASRAALEIQAFFFAGDEAGSPPGAATPAPRLGLHSGPMPIGEAAKPA